MGEEQEGLLGSWSQPGCSGEQLGTPVPPHRVPTLSESAPLECVEKLPGGSKAHGGPHHCLVCSFSRFGETWGTCHKPPGEGVACLPLRTAPQEAPSWGTGTGVLAPSCTSNRFGVAQLPWKTVCLFL